MPPTHVLKRKKLKVENGKLIKGECFFLLFFKVAGFVSNKIKPNRRNCGESVAFN